MFNANQCNVKYLNLFKICISYTDCMYSIIVVYTVELVQSET
jgi:hypothetical protein